MAKGTAHVVVAAIIISTTVVTAAVALGPLTWPLLGIVDFWAVTIVAALTTARAARWGP
jgi:hypothetical protein